MPKSRNVYAGLTEFELSNLRHRARRLALNPLLSDFAVEDIEQDFLAHILERRPSFDPDRASWPTFVDRILLAKTLDMLSAARAGKRRAEAPPISIDADAMANAVDLIDPLALEPTGADIRVDLARRTASLPHELASLLCELRQKTMTEVARDSGIPKTTLYARLAALRRELSPLQEYLR